MKLGFAFCCEIARLFSLLQVLCVPANTHLFQDSKPGLHFCLCYPQSFFTALSCGAPRKQDRELSLICSQMIFRNNTVSVLPTIVYFTLFPFILHISLKLKCVISCPNSLNLVLFEYFTVNLSILKKRKRKNLRQILQQKTKVDRSKRESKILGF
jgi:hypothetical protein